MQMSDKEAAQKVILYAESILNEGDKDDAPTLALCVLAYVMDVTNQRMDPGKLEAAVYSFPGVEAVKKAAIGGEE
jgi:hypothetical protein